MRKYLMTMGAIFLANLALVWAQGPDDMPERRRERMQDLAIWKMLEVLDLSDEQTDRFLPAFRQMQKQEARLQEERRRLIDELEQALSQGGKPQRINNLIQQVRGLERQGEEIKEGFFKQAEDILTIQQLGKLILFQDRFERHLREMIRQTREERMRELQEREGR